MHVRTRSLAQRGAGRSMARLKDKKQTRISRLETENEKLKQKLKEIAKDISTAKRCLDFQYMKCGNKRCLNERCPLNDNT